MLVQAGLAKHLLKGEDKENMKGASLVRQQVEHLMRDRMPGALSPQQRTDPERTLCGVSAIDELLHGGLPARSLTELVGQECSGRTSIALAYMTAITQAGMVCAWVDAADELEPESAAASGVDLERLLWVRCGTGHGEAAERLVTAARNVSTRSTCVTPEPLSMRGGSPHPRSEGKDMPKALEALMQTYESSLEVEARQKADRRAKKSVGTPGAPNRPLTPGSAHREIEVDFDRLPPRRGDNLRIPTRRAEPLPEPVASVVLCESVPLSPTQAFGKEVPSRRSWPLLDKALRATDLLLQGGGFACIVLDLGSIPPNAAWRIPLATWFRFRAACERTRSSLVLLTQHPCTRSSAELVVRLERGTMRSQNRVMTGVQFQAAVERSRSNESGAQILSFRKPPQSERPGAWKSTASWVHTR